MKIQLMLDFQDSKLQLSYATLVNLRRSNLKLRNLTEVDFNKIKEGLTLTDRLTKIQSS